MSETTSCYSVLPWTIPTSLQNFVPECSRIFVKGDYSLFICWRSNSLLLFTFRSKFEELSSETPIHSQAITTKEQILDIIEVDHSIILVSHTGLFQTIVSKGRRPWEILKHLDDSNSFSVTDAFELSPLKIVKTVTAIPDTNDGSLCNYFVAITYSEENCKIDAELYSVSHSSSFKCRLLAVICISNNVSKSGKCFSTFLTHDQAASIFSHLRDAEILLIGLESGQLFCLPLHISENKIGIKPSPKLIYQSNWPIVGLSCPTDGFNIFIYLEGGTTVNISPVDKQSEKLDHSFLSYNSFTLSYPLKFFSAPKFDVLYVSDGVITSVVHIFTSSQVDIKTIPVKGITALTAIPHTSFVLASTFHNSFYLLNSLDSVKISEDIAPLWTGCSLDVSLQLVEDMKVQTQMLSQIKQELQDENQIINALSTVARAHLLADQFPIVAKVSSTLKELEQEISSNSAVFQIAIEIRNNSSEEFTPLLWSICVNVKNPDGQTITKTIPLIRTFKKNFPFSTLMNIPYLFGKFCFPIFVDASLIGNIRDSKFQWLKIRLGEITLDVSHFFTVSVHAPQQCAKLASDVLEFLDQLQGNSKSSVQGDEEKRKALMTTYMIPIPEVYRQPDRIIEKLLSNCQHNQKLLTTKDFSNQSDKTVIWLHIFHEAVQLVFRKSCTSISISCSNLDLLHSVKLSLANMFIGDDCKSSQIDTRPGDSTSVNTASCKARNINAVLETLSLEDEKDVSQLLDIYQDLRNNVSSQIY